MVISTKIGPINIDGHVFKISDLDKTYFNYDGLRGCVNESNIISGVSVKCHRGMRGSCNIKAASLFFNGFFVLIS